MAGMPVAADRAVRFAEMTSAEFEAATMEDLCLRVADGESLTAICKAWDLPRSRIAAWLVLDLNRKAAYENAQELYADALMSETVGISDGDGDVPRDSLRVNTRMKVAAKLYRSRFGESMQHTGKKDEPLLIERIERVIVDPTASK